MREINCCKKMSKDLVCSPVEETLFFFLSSSSISRPSQDSNNCDESVAAGTSTDARTSRRPPVGFVVSFYLLLVRLRERDRFGQGREKAAGD